MAFRGSSTPPSDPDPDSLAVDLRPTQEQKARAWRLHQLVIAGYPVALAEQIAHSPVDLHVAVQLLAGGCTAELALRILL